MEFKVDDLMSIHLRKEKFSQGKFGKLKLKADGPFKVSECIGENTYKIKLLEE